MMDETSILAAIGVRRSQTLFFLSFFDAFHVSNGFRYRQRRGGLLAVELVLRSTDTEIRQECVLF
jgi:hypothetical protein